MKRRFKLKMSSFLLFGGLLLAFNACKEEELIFPPQVGEGTEVTEMRPTARPTNLTYVSAFNKNVEIYWPALSDRVVKAQIKYTDDGVEKVLDVTKFDTPTIIGVSEVKAYAFALQYFTADGTPSKVSKTELIPRTYEADYKIENMSVEPISGGVEFVFPKTSEREIPVKVSYVLDGKPMQQNLSSNKMDTLRIRGFEDETKIIDFITKMDDEVWKRNLSTNTQIAPGIISYKAIVPTLTTFIDGKDAVLSWKNVTGNAVNVTFTYEGVGEPKTASITKSRDSEGSLRLDVGGRGGVIKAIISDEGGTSPLQKILLFAPIARTNWTAQVSSIETNEGADNGKASSLIDGNINTYWHSTWSSEGFNYPHWFIINFGKVESLGKFGMIRRHNNTGGGFKTFNIEVSLDGKAWTIVGQNLTFHSEASPAAWQDYELTPVKAQYVRITMTVPYTAGATSTHLAEFRAFERD